MENKTATVSSPPVTPAIGRDRGALSFSLLVWAVMLTAALCLVLMYGSNVPAWDDWDIVPTATGHRPVTTEWLWSQHNDHRAPIPRLLLLAMMRWIAMDFRVGMYFNVFSTGILALAMILTARRLRGRSSYLDGFFPVAVMTWGQAVNFLWCWQVQYSASVLLLGAVLLLIVHAGGRPRLLTSIGAGTCIILLPLCGANGLGLVPALTLWLGYVAVLCWRADGPSARRDAMIVAGFALTAVVLVSLYFVGYRPSPYVNLTHSVRSISVGAAQFLSMGFGPGVVGLSFDGRTPMFLWKFVCVAVVALFGVTGLQLVVVWWTQPEERARAAGLSLTLAAMICLAFGVGMGRNALEPRYVTLSVPGLCAIYFAWTLYGPPRLGPILRTVIFATAVIAFAPNTVWGWRWADYINSHLAALERDIKAGVPPYQLHQFHAELHQDHEIMMDYMPMLRRARVGAFRYLRDDPPFREVAVPLTPVETHLMKWENGTADATDKEAWLTFTLPSGLDVAGIRLDYTYSNTNAIEPFLGIYWKSSGQRGFAEESSIRYHPLGDRANWRHGTWSRLGDELTTFHAWTSGPVQSVRIVAVEKATIDIHKVTVLVPANDAH